MEILGAVYTVGGEQHGLTGTLALVLGDISRVSVEAFFSLQLGRGVQATLDGLAISGEERTGEHVEGDG